MAKDIKALFRSFKYAFEGIFSSVLSERNMRIHIVCMIYMYSFLSLTDWFVLSRTDWAILFIANAIVVMGELINTAIESAVDLATKEIKPLAKKAKDAAAGAVLVGAIFAVCTGIALLLQKEAFIKLYTYFSTHMVSLMIFIASLILACIFILKGFPKRKNGEEKTK